MLATHLYVVPPRLHGANEDTFTFTFPSQYRLRETKFVYAGSVVQ